jgi:hypothetical protein
MKEVEEEVLGREFLSTVASGKCWALVQEVAAGEAEVPCLSREEQQLVAAETKSEDQRSLLESLAAFHTKEAVA